MSRIHSHDRESCYGVFPDLAMLGEYIGGGCSLSVVGGRKDVMAKCVSQSLITQEGIYDNGDSALAANRVLTEEKINEANRLEEKLREYVELTVRDDTTPMVQATGLGSMVGLDFKGTRPERLRHLYFYLLHKGIYVGHRDFICPPIAHEREARRSVQ